MSQFYARYVPPKTSNSSEANTPKRKRTDTKSSDRDTKKPKHEEDSKKDDILSKYSSSKTAQKQDKDVLVRHKKKEKRKSLEVTGTDNEDGTDGSNTKHSSILSKFRSSSEAATADIDLKPDTQNESQQLQTEKTEETEQKHGLEPIPQPRSVAQPVPYRPFSSQPEWISRPIRADKHSNAKFDSFAFNEALLERLQAQGHNSALPIQAAVLSLLQGSSGDQRTDICVAAATGSGKTLAYVLPILQSLQNRNKTKLRGVIIAPTRTLVRQVTQLCQALSGKSGVHVASAEGSKSLQEEQRSLVQETEVHDITEYRRRGETPVDWSQFSLKKIIERAKNKNVIESIGYVKNYSSKVDLLITTPGRLVEHLQFTEGFNLDNVEWFVVDEADRLLNETFQEWHEVVMPALRSQAATESRDKLLASRRIATPPRRVTKILLSATMTDDISKLMLLDLQNPRLVVIGDESSHKLATQKDSSEDAAQQTPVDNKNLQIPDTLTETAVPLRAKDGDEKPLFLLQLLQHHILEDSKPNSKNEAYDRSKVSRVNSDTSSDESDSDVTDEDSTDSSISSSSSSMSEESSKSENSMQRDVSTSRSVPTGPSSTQSRKSRALVFVKSTESAARLARLLSLLQPDLEDHISIYTSGSNARTSAARTLASFRAGRTTVLISTDLAGRGLNVEDLEHVVNYDVPNNVLTYIHRIGRTARAGKTGHAWTLVEHRQGKWFWEVIGEKGAKDPKIGRQQDVKKLILTIDDDDLRLRYQNALKQLGQDVKGT